MNQYTATWAKLAASVFFCGLAASAAHAQSSDALLNKLVSKGILTAEEAKELSKDVAKVPAAPMPVSSWVSSLKFSGDVRGRYDGVYQSSGNSGAGNAIEDRTRFRYRVRFGVTASMTDHLEAGIRLASGEINGALNAAGTGILGSFGGSPFSANTTMNNDASRKFIFVDLAYGKWAPAKWAQFEVGKMISPFWFTDMVLDPDYNPEGGQEKLSYDLGEKHRFSATSGQYVIMENYSAGGTGNNNDTYLFVNQIDWNAKWTERLSSRVAVGMINFKNQGDISPDLETFINQNGTPAAGPGAESFNPIIGRAELTFNLKSFPCFHGAFPITVGGEYVQNPAAPSHINEGYNLGVTFGSSKAKGNWQINYNYKNIETAATWRGLNDDDFGYNAKGGTDVRGHQVIASYHPADPFTFNVRYMLTERIINAPDTQSKQNRLFLDLVWAF
jgi:Putative porin